MKKALKILLSICCLAFTACQTETPFYQLETLQGRWQRTQSTDSHSDSLIVVVTKDSAVIDSVPIVSNFVVGQKKWINIIPIATDGHFELYDLSKDGNRWKAIITMNSKTLLKIKNKDYPNAPGSEQTWVKIP